MYFVYLDSGICDCYSATDAEYKLSALSSTIVEHGFKIKISFSIIHDLLIFLDAVITGARLLRFLSLFQILSHLLKGPHHLIHPLLCHKNSFRELADIIELLGHTYF